MAGLAFVVTAVGFAPVALVAYFRGRSADGLGANSVTQYKLLLEQVCGRSVAARAGVWVRGGSGVDGGGESRFVWAARSVCWRGCKRWTRFPDGLGCRGRSSPAGGLSADPGLLAWQGSDEKVTVAGAGAVGCGSGEESSGGGPGADLVIRDSSSDYSVRIAGEVECFGYG